MNSEMSPERMKEIREMCQHCALPIEYSTACMAWKHTDTDSVRCDQQFAEPAAEVERLRAAPLLHLEALRKIAEMDVPARYDGANPFILVRCVREMRTIATEALGLPAAKQVPRCQPRQPHGEKVQCELREGHGHIHLSGEYCWPLEPESAPSLPAPLGQDLKSATKEK